MSKAFTKEDDDAPIAPTRRRGVPVPDPNYLTARGMADARAELAAASDPGSSDRARELADHLSTAEVLEPGDRGEVGFGATVTVEDDAGTHTRYQLVGAIEADPGRGALHWQSPIARALWGARVGESRELPRGEVTVVAIAYD